MINPTVNPSPTMTPGEIRGLRNRVKTLMVVCLLGLLYAAIGLATVNLRYGKHILADRSLNPGRIGAIPAPRGRILDRNGNVLVDNRTVSTLFVNPSRVSDGQREPLAMALSQYLGCDVNLARQALAQKASTRKVLIGEMSAPEIERYENLPRSSDTGLLLREVGVLWREDRSYPAGSMAGPVLGYTGMREDGQAGLAGLEYLYDHVLSSRYGEYTDLRDQRGNRVPGTRTETVPPRYGSDLVLTLDADIQALAEATLSTGMIETGAIGGAIVVTDPSTGDILALASLPAVDPSNYSPSLGDETATCSRATSLPYEAGSVMKIFTVAAALEEKLVNTSELFNVTNGPLKIGNYAIHEVNYRGGDMLDLRTIIVKSSNRGAALIAMRLGYDRLDTWLRKFGFGQATGVGFPSEPVGDLKEWMGRVPDIDLANMGFGHGVRISPLQLTQGIGVFANNGVLAPLRLVKARRDPATAGQVVFDPRPTVRVLDPTVASTLQDFMIGVVEEGTSTAAKNDWTCAGKSGTAQKPLPEPQRGYYTDRFFGTFAGYGPIPNPRYVIAVILDEPAVPHYGGAACGPIFRQLFTALMLHDGTPSQRVLDGNTTPLQSRSRGSEPPDPSEFVLARNPFDTEGNGN